MSNISSPNNLPPFPWTKQIKKTYYNTFGNVFGCQLSKQQWKWNLGRNDKTIFNKHNNDNDNIEQEFVRISLGKHIISSLPSKKARPNILEAMGVFPTERIEFNLLSCIQINMLRSVSPKQPLKYIQSGKKQQQR